MRGVVKSKGRWGGKSEGERINIGSEEENGQKERCKEEEWEKGQGETDENSKNVFSAEECHVNSQNMPGPCIKKEGGGGQQSSENPMLSG